MKILVIQTLAMGDMLMITPLLTGLKKKLLMAETHVIGNEIYEPLLKNNPDVDRYISLPQSKLIELANLPESSAVIETLNFIAGWASNLDTEYDIVINPCFNDMAGALGFLALRNPDSKPDSHWGAQLSLDGSLTLQGDWPACTYNYIHGPSLNTFHMADVHCLTAGIRPRKKSGLRYYLTDEEKSQAAELLTQLGLDKSKPIVAMQVGAGAPFRRWPVEGFIQVGKYLTQNGFNILLTGSKDEENLTNQVAEGIGPGAFSIAGRTDLGGLAALLKICKLLISNDTGTVHMASAMGTPVVGIFLGKAQFRTTGPHGEGNLAIQADIDCSPCFEPEKCSHLRCQNVITSDDVIAGAAHVLGKKFVKPENSRSRFLQSFYARDGLLHWKSVEKIPEDLKQMIMDAYRKIWLRMLDPEGVIKSPKSRHQTSAAHEPFAEIDAICGRALDETVRLLDCLEKEAPPDILAESVAEMGKLTESFRQAGFRNELLAPTTAYFILRLGGLVNPDPVKLVQQQADLYKKVQAIIRTLALKFR